MDTARILAEIADEVRPLVGQGKAIPYTGPKKPKMGRAEFRQPPKQDTANNLDHGGTIELDGLAHHSIESVGASVDKYVVPPTAGFRR